MPSFKIAGKSKEDLSAIAQIAGLLTAEQTAKMTKSQLVRFLEQENEKAEHGTSQAAVSAGSDTTGQAGHLPEAESEAAEAPASARKRAPARRRKADKQPASSPEQLSLPVPAAGDHAVPSASPARPAIRRIQKQTKPAVPEVLPSGAGMQTIQPEPAQHQVPVPPAVPEAMPASRAVDVPEVMPDSQDNHEEKDETTPAPAPVRTVARRRTSRKKPAEQALPGEPVAVEDGDGPDAPPVQAAGRAKAGDQAITDEPEASAVVAEASTAAPLAAAEPVSSQIRANPEVQQSDGSGQPAKAASPKPRRNGRTAEERTAAARSPRRRTRAVANSSDSAPAGSLADELEGPSDGQKEGQLAQENRQTPGQAAEPVLIQPDDRTSGSAITETDLAERAGKRRPARKRTASRKSDDVPAGQTDAIQDEAAREEALAEQVLTGQTAVADQADGKKDETSDIQELSPEASEAASERDVQPAGPQNTGRTAPGRRSYPDLPGTVSRIPRSRIATRQIRPADPSGSQADTRQVHLTADTASAPEASQRPEPDRLPAHDRTVVESGPETTAPPAAAAQPGTEAEPVRDKRPVIESGEIQGGVLEIMPDGYGFLRKDNYLQGSKDIYVPPQYIRRFGLRPGDFVTGPVRLQRENDRYQALLYIKDVNGMPPEKMIKRPHFDRLTPIYPDERFVLETTRNELSTRIIDLVAPIGKGQRGMIVSPPKAGKTILLQKIANAVSINNPDTKLIVLLIDERPEEVTDMQRSIKGEVVYSTFDKTPENHTKVVELVLERAMRLVELKQDVMILLDSMTRLARAYNLTINPTGRTLSGGLDPGALYGPKRFFGAARNIENGGSLTIIATSLIETGSRMDEVIFEEFKGTGNMEVYLDRKLSEKRIFPAIDINKSGTRREELLMNSKELDAVWTIRKAFSQLDTSAVTEAIINLLLKTRNNEHFISSVNVSFNDRNVFEAMRGNRPGAQGGQGGQGGASPGNGQMSGYGNGGYNTSGYGSNYRRHTATSSNDDD